MSERNYDNFIYFPHLDAVFCFVPKVACTGWKMAARRLMGEQDWENPRLAHDRKRCGLRFLSAQRNADLNSIQNSSLRLGMVRNPYSRLLSAYLDKVERRLDNALLDLSPDGDYWWQVVHAIERFRCDELQGKSRSITFKIFLQWLQQSNHEAVNNNHWAPQAKLTGMGLVDWTVLGHFESLHLDAPRIFELLGASFSFPSNTQRHRTNASKKLHTYYSSDSVALVNELFSEDFKLFNYTRAESARDIAQHAFELVGN